MESEHLREIRTGFELFGDGEFERSLSHLSPEIEWDTSSAVPDGRVFRGREEVLSFWTAVVEDHWAEFRIEPERWIDGGDVVLMLGHMAARGQGSGVPVEGTWDQVWRISDGLAVRCENYVDRARAWRESGLDPRDFE